MKAVLQKSVMKEEGWGFKIFLKCVLSFMNDPLQFEKESISDVAKVRSADRMRPLDLFCYLEKQRMWSIKTNLLKNCTYFLTISFKRADFFLLRRSCAAREEI